MQFRDLCPVWVISTLDKESGEAFAKKMERQLMAFSKNEFGNAFDTIRDRWWRIDNIEDVSELIIDGEGYPADVPVYKKRDGHNVDTTCLNVVLFGVNQDFGKCISAIKALREQKANNTFMIGNAARVRFYGLFSFKKGEEIDNNLVELLRDNKKNKRKTNTPETRFLFDSLFLQGSCNRVEGNGTDFCYPNLIDSKTGKRHDWDLAVQIIYHLALSHGTLTMVDGRRLNVVGAFSLNFEPEKEKRSLAIKLTNAIVSKFSKNTNGEHWFDNEGAGLSKEFEEAHGWYSIYGQLKLGYKNLDTKDLIPQSDVSPWRLLLRELIPYYFKKYIRGLVRHVHDNVDGFLFVTMRNYESHVNNQLEQISHEKELRKHIETELFFIWDKENMDNITVGMQQFLSKVNNLIDFFKEQKEKINELSNAKTADGRNHVFPKLEDYPLGNFGEYQDCYAKLIRTNPNETITKGLDVTGDGLLKKVTRTLAFHPVPLSLLVRSILAGLLLPMVLLVILRLIPDYFINTGVLEKTPGCYWLSLICFLLCVSVAIMKYGFGVIGKIRDNLKSYVACCLYKIQLSAYHYTLKKEKEYYKRAEDICAEIQANADTFIKIKTELKEDKTQGFEENMFQANIIEVYNGHNILKDGTLVPKIKTVVNRHGEDYRQEEIIPTPLLSVNDELHYGIFRNTVIIEDKNGIKKHLKKCLFEQKCLKEQESIDVMTPLKEKFCSLLEEEIIQTIDFFVTDRKIHSLKDIVFDETGRSNLMTWEQGQHEDFSMSDIIQQRSYPSAEVSMESFNYASVVFPNDGSTNANLWRNLLYLRTDNEDKFDTHIGNYELSILQGFSIDDLDSINDFKNV